MANYPLMQPADAVKLAYQSEFGPAHMVSDLNKAEAMIERETETNEKSEEPLFTPIGGGFVRVNLLSKDCCYSPAFLARVFAASASLEHGSKEGLLEKLSMIRDICKEKLFCFTEADLERYLDGYENAGYPPVSHSPTYKEAYGPAYRVIKLCYAEILPLLSAIDALENANHDAPVVVGIDGRAAAGKTTLAKVIASVFDCNVFHMDDFFLPPSLRTAERLAEPGGNVHYERFKNEVLSPLLAGEDVVYGVFDCSVMAIGEERHVVPKKLNVIEGSYSGHPYFGEVYALRCFAEISSEKQMDRILIRNGERMAERFRALWIPMENRYFDIFQIKEKSDYVLQLESEGFLQA